MTNREIKTLNRAIKELAKNYKADLENSYIKNPIAHALYITWKVFNKGTENDAYNEGYDDGYSIGWDDARDIFEDRDD